MTEKLMSFWEHIAELRQRIIYCVIFVIAGFFIAYAFHKEIFDIMTVPIMNGLKSYGFTKLQAISVQEMIFVYFQQSLFFGFALASPLILYQVWAFVAPGLYLHEKRYVIPAIFVATLFFIAGALFCYFVFLPIVVKFLVSFSVEKGSVTVIPTVRNSYILVLATMLIFGLFFELPIIMFFLALARVVSSRSLLRFFKYFILIAFVIGGVLTPPDPISQILMGVPICLLYLTGIGAVYLLELFRGGEETSKTTRLFRAITALTVIAILFIVVGFSIKHFYEKEGAGGGDSEPPSNFSFAYGFTGNQKYREKYPALPEKPVYLKSRVLLSNAAGEEDELIVKEQMRSCSIAWFHYPEVGSAVNSSLFGLCEQKESEYISGCFNHGIDYILAEITMKVSEEGHNCIERLHSFFKRASGFKGELLASLEALSDGDFDYDISNRRFTLTFFIEKKREFKLTKELHRLFAMVTFYDNSLHGNE